MTPEMHADHIKATAAAFNKAIEQAQRAGVRVRYAKGETVKGGFSGPLTIVEIARVLYAQPIDDKLSGGGDPREIKTTNPTDELIETLEQRQTKAMAFEREHGLEGLVTLSIDEAGLILSALKENKRLRDVIEDAVSFMEDRGFVMCECGQADCRTSKLRAALQPQGEK